MTEGRPLKLPRGALATLRESDPAFAEVMARVGRCRLRVGETGDPLEALVRAIVGQQLTGKAAATIYGRVRALYPEGAFPSAADVLRTHHTKLRKAGLSRQKQAAVRDLCRHVDRGKLQLHALDQLADEALIEQLVAVRGIGRWSAQMFLMFHLGRLDVWAPDDLGIRKAVARLHRRTELPKPREMHELGVPFAPYRTVASWYLWRSLELDPRP